MASGMQLIVYPVKDLAQAKKLYSALLGVAPYVDSPYYVGFRVGDQEIGLDPNGHLQGLTAPLAYWWVDDIKGVCFTSVGAARLLRMGVLGAR